MPFLIPIAIAAGSAIASAATAVGGFLGIGAAGAAAGGITMGGASLIGGMAPAVAAAATGGGVMGAITSALPWVSAASSLMSGVSGMITGNKNAAMSEAEGKAAMVSARENSARVARENESKLGTMNAIAGASGTTVNEGSSLLAYLDATKQAQLMQEDEIYKGRMKMFSKTQEAMNSESEGFGSLIGGIGNAASALLKGKSLLTA